MKECFACKNTKPLDEFYCDSRNNDGHMGKCKECVKSGAIAHRLKNIEAYRAYGRKRGRTQEYKDRNKKWRKDNRERYNALVRKSALKHKDKKPVRSLIGNLKRDGKLFPKPCEVCGATERINAHHPDYSKPLEVIWLCSKHHGEVHRKYAE